ncbi:MAG: mevalonate kinase [Candidatus Gottesmanbacteria bacterium]|nr:mevalonate kinase [Candidatus Gottesmanbacteria bacterium]
MVSVTAPGKLLLMGEHAVVYGYPSLVTAIDERLTVEAEKIVDSRVEVNAPQAGDTRFVDESVRQAQRAWGIPGGGFRINTQSTFSGKYGFGSSAAVTVATLKALALLYQKDIDQRKLFDISYKTVIAVQGVGSGFDVAAAIYGGTIYFVTGGKVIEPLKSNELPFIVGYTGVKADTTTLIKQVAEKKEKNPEKVERIFQAIAKLVDEAKLRILEGDWERVGRLMDFNQEYLRDLGVSSEKLEAMIGAAKKAGAWGAKLSGAGGGDCMIAVARSDKREAIRKAIQEAGGEVIDVHPNAQGVRVETTDDQGEVFIVVDKDDKVLGFRSRYDCHHDKSLIHRTVGAVIVDTKGNVLLQKRSSSKDTGAGLWGISCAGHVRKGQVYEETLHRELQEELGVDMPISLIAKFVVQDDQESEMAALYRGVSNGPFRINHEEVECVEFFSPRELPFKVATKEIVLTKCAEISLQKAGFLS